MKAICIRSWKSNDGRRKLEMFTVYEFRDEQDHDTDWVIINKQNPKTPSFVLSYPRRNYNRDAPLFDDYFIKI